MLGIICGYEDLNDHEQLRDDSMLALAVGKADVTGATRKRQRDQGHALAGKSTLNRLELAAPTDDPVHGEQEGRFFHGFYGHYCYLPLYVFCGEFLLGATLLTADVAPG